MEQSSRTVIMGCSGSSELRLASLILCQDFSIARYRCVNRLELRPTRITLSMTSIVDRLSLRRSAVGRASY